MINNNSKYHWPNDWKILTEFDLKNRKCWPISTLNEFFGFMVNKFTVFSSKTACRQHITCKLFKNRKISHHFLMFNPFVTIHNESTQTKGGKNLKRIPGREREGSTVHVTVNPLWWTTSSLLCVRPSLSLYQPVKKVNAPHTPPDTNNSQQAKQSTEGLTPEAVRSL